MNAPDSIPPPNAPNETITPALLGHAQALSLWQEALQSRRMHHAWLLCGARGIGKASLALTLARQLLAIPAGARNESHPDLLILEREWDDKRKRRKAFISVENVRRVSAFFSRSAGRGGWRICIVDSADEMNHNAANALLKILEEPPSRALFLLVSHRPQLLPATILSRCRRLRLDPLDREQMLQWLQHAHPDLAPQHARLALLAEGSPGRAHALVAQEGLELYDDMIALLQGLPTGFDMAAAHLLADRLSGAGQESLYREFLELLRGFLERFIRAALAEKKQEQQEQQEQEQQEQLTPGESQLLARLQPKRLDAWIQVWEKIDPWIDAVERLQMNRKHILLLAFAQLEAAAD